MPLWRNNLKSRFSRVLSVQRSFEAHFYFCALIYHQGVISCQGGNLIHSFDSIVHIAFAAKTVHTGWSSMTRLSPLGLVHYALTVYFLYLNPIAIYQVILYRTRRHSLVIQQTTFHRPAKGIIERSKEAVGPVAVMRTMDRQRALQYGASPMSSTLHTIICNNELHCLNKVALIGWPRIGNWRAAQRKVRTAFWSLWRKYLQHQISQRHWDQDQTSVKWMRTKMSKNSRNRVYYHVPQIIRCTNHF